MFDYCIREKEFCLADRGDELSFSQTFAWVEFSLV